MGGQEGPQRKSRELIARMLEVLTAHHPMTVRQVYYRMVTLQVIENSMSGYRRVANQLILARWAETIPRDWIEDRTRIPRRVPMWHGLRHFFDSISEQYRRNVWVNQPTVIECWLEKDALSGIFQAALQPFGITLNVGKGFDSLSAVFAAAKRFGRGEKTTVLYFGDFDPSGEDMVRALRENLERADCRPTIIKCALLPEDIERYSLPPDFAKATDTRSPAFIARHGDVAVELDALPIDVLQARIVEAIEAHMDLDALARTRATEAREQRRLARLLRRR